MRSVQAKRVECRTFLFDGSGSASSLQWTSLFINAFTIVYMQDVTGEERSLLYIPRLAAFALLIVAIVRKNIGGRQKS